MNRIGNKALHWIWGGSAKQPLIGLHKTKRFFEWDTSTGHGLLVRYKSVQRPVPVPKGAKRKKEPGGRESEQPSAAASPTPAVTNPGGSPGIPSGASPGAQQPNSANRARLSESPVNGGESGDKAARKKKARTTFTGRQIFELERQFEIKKYLSSSERAEMAKLLNVTETQDPIGTRYKWLGKSVPESSRSYTYTCGILSHWRRTTSSAGTYFLVLFYAVILRRLSPAASLTGDYTCKYPPAVKEKESRKKESRRDRGRSPHSFGPPNEKSHHVWRRCVRRRRTLPRYAGASVVVLLLQHRLSGVGRSKCALHFGNPPERELPPLRPNQSRFQLGDRWPQRPGQRRYETRVSRGGKEGAAADWLESINSQIGSFVARRGT
ncbi:hypothetical protein HPB49_022170 [Dermacentor silvarum]|uniref:Uncharacterized protein n=1 Tax=Dermacentor silvarum TaxID=543639 RepID=A0ACB8E3H8_DERSI|nr:hypothetical protein HPB49_022170 [Dermacentor silvarum]